jgi:hypothetical protein
MKIFRKKFFIIRNFNHQAKMRKAPIVSLKCQLKQKCVQMISNSSFAGIPRIASRDSVIQKIFWSFITIIMIVLFSVSIANNVADYFNYSVVTNINTEYAKELPFPAVLICHGDVLSCEFNRKPC